MTFRAPKLLSTQLECIPKNNPRHTLTVETLHTSITYIILTVTKCFQKTGTKSLIVSQPSMLTVENCGKMNKKTLKCQSICCYGDIVSCILWENTWNSCTTVLHCTYMFVHMHMYIIHSAILTCIYIYSNPWLHTYVHVYSHTNDIYIYIISYQSTV